MAGKKKPEAKKKLLVGLDLLLDRVKSRRLKFGEAAGGAPAPSHGPPVCWWDSSARQIRPSQRQRRPTRSNPCYGETAAGDAMRLPSRSPVHPVAERRNRYHLPLRRRSRYRCGFRSWCIFSFRRSRLHGVGLVATSINGRPASRRLLAHGCSKTVNWQSKASRERLLARVAAPPF